MGRKGYERWFKALASLRVTEHMASGRHKGFFFTFEGIEGSGKSTQAALLVARLKKMSEFEVLLLREPGGTAAGESIRKLVKDSSGAEPLQPETELFLFAASRTQLVKSVIMPALERGAVVVCDRFYDSTTAYQAFGRRIEMEKVRAINAIAVGSATPDLTLLLDLDVETGFSRLHERNGARGCDRFEKEDKAFHERVRAGYHELASSDKQSFRVLNANLDPSVLVDEIWSAVKDVIG